MDIRNLTKRLAALETALPNPARTDPAITAEQRQAMAQLEADLLGRPAPFADRDLEAMAQKFLRFRRICREADAHARRPFRLTYGIEVSPMKGEPS